VDLRPSGWFCHVWKGGALDDEESFERKELDEGDVIAERRPVPGELGRRSENGRASSSAPSAISSGASAAPFTSTAEMSSRCCWPNP
jgi:hypothetical protein